MKTVNTTELVGVKELVSTLIEQLNLAAKAAPRRGYRGSPAPRNFVSEPDWLLVDKTWRPGDHENPTAKAEVTTLWHEGGGRDFCLVPGTEDDRIYHCDVMHINFRPPLYGNLFDDPAGSALAAAGLAFPQEVVPAIATDVLAGMHGLSRALAVRLLRDYPDGWGEAMQFGPGGHWYPATITEFPPVEMSMLARPKPGVKKRRQFIETFMRWKKLELKCITLGNREAEAAMRLKKARKQKASAFDRREAAKKQVVAMTQALGLEESDE